MPPTRTQILGRAGERLALEHYERLGYRVLARNHHTREGELDLIVRNQDNLVFVEVKSSRSGSRDPFEWITAAKCRRLRNLAKAWLQDHPPFPPVREVRFDAVGIVISSGGRLVSLEQREAIL